MEANSLKLLAIDDNRDNLTTLKAVVADRLPGVRVLAALDGRQGLELAQTEDPDVVLLDIVMPGMNGYEVCRKLKEDDRLRAIPVLFLTALRTDLTSRITALDAGADGFLSKPFDEIELVAQIRAMIKIKEANRLRRREKEELEELVTQRTSQLEQELAERRQAEGALRESGERHEQIIQNVQEGIIVYDRDLRCREWNPFMERLSGLMAREVLGKQPLELFPFLEGVGVVERLKAALAGETPDPVEMPYQAPGSAELRHLFDLTAPLKNSNGEIVGCVAIVRDITEIKHHAEEKARLEDQLHQAQKMEAIGTLAGGVAHDFNNLTAIVLGYAQMLLGQLRPEDGARKYVEQIVKAGERSAALTRQLLAFSRRQTLLPVVLDFNALLLDLEKMLGRLIGEDIQLKFRLGANVGCVTADPGQIQQVVTNLVINARDAMPRGGTLIVETAVVELDEAQALDNAKVIPGRYVMLSLTDTGVGMGQETLARLFEPFFTTKEKGKGTGLGLATAHGIVKQSGGYIWVASDPGKGTTFTICLPWTDAKPKSRSVACDEEAPRRGGGERVLLVEDEAALLELCETVLSRLGYRVSAAANGREALGLVREQGLEPDLVVTDLVMPEMSGFELVERLRENQPDLGVLFMSGYPDETIARHGVIVAGMHFLPKPFSERELAEKAHEALSAAGAVGRPAVRQGRRVLMIDDDQQYRDLVSHFCSKRGHLFEGLDSATAALVALAGQIFDVLLIDMNIPGTDGERVLREIRAAGHTAPAIVLTGDVATADMDVLRPLGAVLALGKSSDAEPLLRAIEAAGVASS